jgi:DNA-binding NarL/FixJ family response regulator
MKHHDQAMQAILSTGLVDNHIETSDLGKKPCVFIVDQRNLLGGCISSWLDAAHEELLTIVVPDIARALENEDSLDAALAILSVSSMATGHSWLEKQMALIRERSADLPVVIIMDDDEEAHRPDLLVSLGVQGYIPTSSRPNVVLLALWLVIAGGCYYPHSGESAARKKIRIDLTSSNDQAIPTNAAVLTRREWEVLDLVADGLPNKIIAYRLDLAMGTVKIHVHHIIDKLKVKNRTEAALWRRQFRPLSKPVSSIAPVDRRSA